MKTNRQKTVVLIIFLIICGAAALLLNACCKPTPATGSKPAALSPPPETQQYEIRSGSNLIAQVDKPVTITARVHRADLPEPVPAEIRLMPGTWLLPEQMFTITDNPDVVCKDGYCEVAK